jgi:hypothetical protein
MTVATASLDALLAKTKRSNKIAFARAAERLGMNAIEFETWAIRVTEWDYSEPAKDGKRR